MRFKNARNYDKFAQAQNWAAKSLVSLIETFRGEFGSVYEIGCGSGLLTKVLLERLEIEHLSLNDLYESQIMDGFHSQIGDICQIEMPKGLDLVVSSSVFQWIDPLEVLAFRIQQALKKGGICAFAMLSEGSLNELSSYTKQGLNYLAPEQIEHIFSKYFDVLAMRTSSYTSQFGSLKELLASLKETGVKNIKGSFVLNKASLAGLEAHFNGLYELSYNYTFLVAQKG